MGNWTKLNELNKPTIMGVPVPDIIQPSKIKKDIVLFFRYKRFLTENKSNATEYRS